MRIAIGVVAAGAVALCSWRLWGTWMLLPFVLLVPFSAVLAELDLRTHRLPNRLVLPGIAASTLLLPAALVADGRWALAWWPVAGGAALFALYLLLALLSREGMGMGDVKLAAIVGSFGGALGLTGWVVAAAAGFVLGGLAALVLAGSRRARLPFAPWMLLGVFAAVAIV